MNWLVTGGCGFLGTALVRALVAEGGHSVRVVDNLAVGEREDLEAVTPFEEVTEVGPMRPDSPVELLVGDILDEELALRAAQGADVIVHLAANTGVMPSIEDPRADCMSNVVGTLNYLEAARTGSSLSTSSCTVVSALVAIWKISPPTPSTLAASLTALMRSPT